MEDRNLSYYICGSTVVCDYRLVVYDRMHLMTGWIQRHVMMKVKETLTLHAFTRLSTKNCNVWHGHPTSVAKHFEC